MRRGNQFHKKVQPLSSETSHPPMHGRLKRNPINLDRVTLRTYKRRGEKPLPVPFTEHVMACSGMLQCPVSHTCRQKVAHLNTSQ